MKYRVVFQDPDDGTPERPVQMLTNSFAEVEKWRDGMLASAQRDTCYVEIFETVELLVSFHRKPKPSPVPEAAK